jgi:hypothetical protein
MAPSVDPKGRLHEGIITGGRPDDKNGGTCRVQKARRGILLVFPEIVELGLNLLATPAGIM